MSAKRIAMRKIREILRLRLEAGLSVRQINASAKVSVGAIQKLLKKADELSLNRHSAANLGINYLIESTE